MLSAPSLETSSMKYLPASPASCALSVTKPTPEPVAAVIRGAMWRRRSALVSDLNISSSRNGPPLASSQPAEIFIRVTGFLYAMDLTGLPPCPPADVMLVPVSEGLFELYMWTGILHSAAG